MLKCDKWEAVAAVMFILYVALFLMVCGWVLLHIDDGENIATQDELTSLIKETPCAARAFKAELATRADEPLTFNEAKALAKACERSVKAEEQSKYVKKQLDAISLGS